MSTQWHLVVLSKYLLILNREVIKWTEHLNLHRISFFFVTDAWCIFMGMKNIITFANAINL